MTQNELTLTEQVQQVLRSKYERMSDDGVIAIVPALLASEAYSDLDPESLAPTLVQWGCVLELRQLARAICRAQHDKQDEGEDQSELFDSSALQERYPARRNGEDAYVLRIHMTEDELRFNVERLRREGNAKLRHADALEAETNQRAARGDFDDTAAG